MREQYFYPHTMFEINPHSRCGLFVPEDIMNDFIRLEAEFMNRVKTLFNDNADKLLSADWTMAYVTNDDGTISEPVYLKYSDANRDASNEVNKRIQLFKPEQPKKVDVYVCNRDTAKMIAEEILQEKLDKKNN